MPAFALPGLGPAATSGRDSIAGRVYQTLRESIINLALKPGDEISMNSMVEQLGVGRSPVRDALHELGTEALVDIIPQRGTFVSRIDLARVYEERFLRASLEEKAVGLAVRNRTPVAIASMRSILGSQEADLARGDLVAFVGHDDAFHEVIFRAAEKPLCWAIVQNLSGHYHRMRLLNQSTGSVPEGVIAQHRELVDAIEAGDELKAIAVCSGHLSRLLSEEGELLERYPDYFATRRN